MNVNSCNLTMTHKGSSLEIFKVFSECDADNFAEVIVDYIEEFNLDVIYKKRLYLTEEGILNIQKFIDKFSKYLNEYPDLKDAGSPRNIDLSRTLRSIKRVQCECGRFVKC